MQTRPKILMRYGRINLPIRVPIIDELVDPLAQTFLVNNTTGGSTNLVVANIIGFEINQVLLIGEPGNENSEIVFTSSVTAPTGSTITTNSGILFPHAANTPVYRLLFNKIELSTALTTGGSKTVLNTVNIVADSPTTDYNDLVATGGYYFARFLSTLQQIYEFLYTGDNDVAIENTGQWQGQSFAPQVAHTINGVILKLYRVGNPGTLTLSVYATSGGFPTGSPLVTTTFDGNVLTAVSPGENKTITFAAGTPLTAGVTYAIVLSGATQDLTNYVNWRRDNASSGATYPRGTAIVSLDNGATWINVANTDNMFQEFSTENYSPYSDPAPYNGYTLLSARSCIDKALMMINKKTSEVLSDEYSFAEIDNCQTECLREFKRWSFMQSFDTIIGETETGTWKVAAPDDLDDQVTYRSIYNFRIGKEPDMMWVDKEEWDAIISGIAYSTLAVQANPGDPTLTLVSSKDFTDEGTIQVGPNQYSWTANNRTTNVLTLNGSTLVLAIAPVNQDVFQYANLGWPSYWSIWGGFIYHWPAIGSSYTHRNYYMDYYKKQTMIQHDSDNIVLPDPTVVQYFLAWKFLLRLNNGETNDAITGMYNNYILRREKMKQKESINRNFILNPDIVDTYNTGGY